jgi:WD40 repeat protein
VGSRARARKACQDHRTRPPPGPQIPTKTPKDDRTLASRGADGTLRLWDLRNFKSPLKTFTGLPTNYSTTNVAFSPDERLVMTGTAAEDPRNDAGGGTVVFVDVKEQRVVRALGMPAHAAAVKWHDRINQIFVGVGERSLRRGAAS